MRLYLFLLAFAFSNIGFAKTITVAVGMSLAPYVIKDTKSGLELETAIEALKSQGIKLVPEFVSMKRLRMMVKKKKVDGALTVLENIGLPLYFTDTYVTYQNFAITTKKDIKIDSVSDLTKGRILAFQDAKVYLGAKYKDFVSQNTKYKETPIQIRQNEYLYKDKIDIVIADKLIFMHNNQSIPMEVRRSKNLHFHEIFKPNHYVAGFIDEEVRNAFNRGLKQIKANGTYNKIKAKYSYDI